MHIVTEMLETNDYVRCILVDFSKAFDTINHSILFAKLSKLSLPANVISWTMNFLTGRSQAVILDGLVSCFIKITQSVVQGSGIGPILYIIYASDLRTISKKMQPASTQMILI